MNNTITTTKGIKVRKPVANPSKLSRESHRNHEFTYQLKKAQIKGTLITITANDKKHTGWVVCYYGSADNGTDEIMLRTNHKNWTNIFINVKDMTTIDINN